MSAWGPPGEDEYDPVSGMRRPSRPRRATDHGPFVVNGRPADLQQLPILDPISWEGAPVPERRWLVPDMIPEGNVTMLGGDGGVGKSQIALQALVACAIGRPWLGRPARRCKAVGIFCEDDRDELHRRVADVVGHYAVSFGDLENLTLLSRVGEPNLLVEFPDQWQAGVPTAFYAQVSQLLHDHGAEFLVLDSLHDLFGGNENARPHARQFIGALRSLAIGMRGAVLLTAHPSLSGRNSGTGEAGSTAWNNAVRSRLYLTSPKSEDGGALDRDYRELKTMKANYASSGSLLKLRWREGVFISDEPKQGVFGAIERQSCETIFVDLLERFTRENRFVSENERAGNYAPKVFAQLKEAAGHSRGDLRRAMEALFSSGRIVVGTYVGTGRHQHRCIRLKEGSE